MAKNTFFKKIFTVLAGGVLAQLISFAAIPVITRLYSQKEFGFFANVTQLAAFLIPVISLCLPLVVVLIKNNTGAKRFVKRTILLNLAITAFLLVLSILSYFFIDFDFYTILIFSILFAFSCAVQELFLYYYIREGYFFERARLLVFQAVLIVLLKIFLALFYSDTFASLAIASVVGYFISNTYIYWCFNFHIVKVADKKSFFARIRRSKNIIAYRTPLAIFDSLSLLLPILYLTYWMSPAYAGLYALARVVLVMPGNILSKSVADVMLPRCVDMHRKKQPINKFLFKYSMLLLTVVSPLMFIFINISEYLFGVIFGSGWAEAALYANWLTLWVAINIINKPYSVVITIFKIEKLSFINGVFNCMLTMFALLVSYFYSFEALNAVALLTLMTMLPQVIIILIGHMKVKVYDESLVSQ